MPPWMGSIDNLQNITFSNYPPPKYQMRNTDKQRIARPKLLVATTQSQFKNLKLYRFIVETPDFPARDIAQGYGSKQYDKDMNSGLKIIAKNTEGLLPCGKSIFPMHFFSSPQCANSLHPFILSFILTRIIVAANGNYGMSFSTSLEHALFQGVMANQKRPFRAAVFVSVY